MNNLKAAGVPREAGERTAGKLRVLYIASSSYSGSTLLAFLLNAHPEIVTIGELDGYRHAAGGEIVCSCGQTAGSCPFLARIGAGIERSGLPFSPRDFRTGYVLMRSGRLNRWLLEEPPRGFRHPVWENLRDGLVRRWGPWARELAIRDEVNRLFIARALEVSGGTVFADVSKNPYRLRQLRRIPALEIRVLHLVRDPRGVALSNLELNKPGWSPAVAARKWAEEQWTIARIAGVFERREVVYYEDLCDRTSEEIARIHRFCGLEPRPLPADFRAVEHHILGNVMRLKGGSEIRKNMRWREALDAKAIREIESTLARFRTRRRGTLVKALIDRYLGEGSGARRDGQSAT